MKARRGNVGRLAGAGLLLAAVAGSTGCRGDQVQRQLEGRWHGASVENVDERLLPQVAGWARGVTFEFRGKKLTVHIPLEAPRRGTYVVTRDEHGEVSLAIAPDEGTGSYEMELILDEPDNIRWMLGGGRAIVLRRGGSS